MGDFVFLSHPLNISLKLDLLLISELLFFHSENSSLLNLINNDLGTLLSSICFSDLSFFFFLENLESFDFHHKIQLLLFLYPLLLKSLILFKLLVTNCDNLCVEDHLVHLLDIIKLIIKLLLRLGQKGLILSHLVLLLRCGLHFLSSSLVHFDHLFLLCFRLGKGSSFLLIGQSLFLQELVFGFDSGGVLDSIQVIFSDDYGVVLVVLFSLLSDGSQLVHGDKTGRGVDTGGELSSLGGGFGSTLIRGTLLVSEE